MKRRIARIGYNIAREIENFFKNARGKVKDETHSGWDTLEIPDVGYGNGKVDMTHALATHLRSCDLNSAALADFALEADLFILSAVAFPVLRRPENSFAEQSVALRLEGAVVDGLRLFDLAERPLSYHFRRSNSDLNGVKRCVAHLLFLLLC